MYQRLKEINFRNPLELGWNSIFLILGFLILAAILIAWTQKPDEELLLEKLKDLDLPIVGVGPNVNVSESLEIGTQTVSSETSE